MDNFNLKIPTPRPRVSFVQFIYLLKAEHALCKSNPGTPSSLHYAEPTGPTFTIHCAGCRGTWTRTVTVDDLAELLRVNGSTAEGNAS